MRVTIITMSYPSKHSEHLKFNHYIMVWRNLTLVDRLAVDVYEIAIGNEHYPIRAGSAAQIRAQEQD